MSQSSTQLFRTSPRRSRNLLIVNKGPGAATLAREGDGWDLLDIYFMPADIEKLSQNPAASDAEHVIFETDRNMRKFAILKRVFADHDFWRAYDTFMIADDDLVPVGCRISDIFDLFQRTGCHVGQPALTEDSFFAHMITIRNNNFVWRKTNFAEVMCPLFTCAGIEKYLSIFDATVSGINLDFFWGYNEWLEGVGVAILDATPMRHLRPVGGGIAYQGMSLEEEADRFMREHGIPWYTLSCLDGEPRPEHGEVELLRLLLTGYEAPYANDHRFHYYALSQKAIHHSMAMLQGFYGQGQARALLHIAAVNLFMNGPHYRKLV